MASYSFYTESYMGTALSEKEFALRNKQAEAVLSRFIRVYGADCPGTDSRDMALCAMAETLSRHFRDAGVSAATVGGVSVRYDNDTTLIRKLYDRAGIYMDFHRGVG